MHSHATTAHTGPARTDALTPLIMAILISAQGFSWFFFVVVVAVVIELLP